MTSTNVTKFIIFDENKKVVGEHSQSCYCKTHWEDLLIFDPPENHTIVPWGYDEEEEYWIGDEKNLKDFLIKVRLIKTEI
jgi:hypothetical protein